MKQKTTRGNDGVVFKMIDALYEFAIDKVRGLTKKTFSTGTISQRVINLSS